MVTFTVSVPDEIYRRACSQATARGTSLEAMVASYLTTLGDSTDFQRLQRLQEQVMSEIRNFNGGDRLTRDEIHDRDLDRPT